MEPIFKRKVGSILEALEAAACSTFNMQDLENEIADILAPTGKLPIRKEIMSTKEAEPVIFGEDFSFVRNKQEYIPGLSIPQEGGSPYEREFREGFGVGYNNPRYHGARGRRGYDRGRSSDRTTRPDRRMRHHMKTEPEAASTLPNKKETITTIDDESVKAGDFSSIRNKQDNMPDRPSPFLERRERSDERGISGFGGGFSGPSSSRSHGGHRGSNFRPNFAGPSSSNFRPGGSNFRPGGSNFRPGFVGPDGSNHRPSFAGPGGSDRRPGFAGSGGSNFRPGFHGDNMRRGFDRGRSSDRSGGRPNRRMRRLKRTPEEEAAILARMKAKDDRAERLILIAGGLLPPDPTD